MGKEAAIGKKYRFTTDSNGYSDYASGAVFYGAPDQPNFPVRLANEVFRRAFALWQASGGAGRCVLYDPCCGSGYLLAVVAYFNGEHLRRVIGSDIDADALSFARRNLGLLTLEGLDARAAEIERLYNQFGKPSHAAALESARRLRERLAGLTAVQQLETRTFRADATDPGAVRQGLGEMKADIVLTDIPYGRRSIWQSDSVEEELPEFPVERLLEALLPVLAGGAVVAVAAEKQARIAHAEYRQAGKLKLGKRQVVFLRPG